MVGSTSDAVRRLSKRVISLEKKVAAFENPPVKPTAAKGEIWSSIVCNYCMHDCKDHTGNKLGCHRFSGLKVSIVK